MNSRISQIAAGVALYLALVLSLYGLSRVAFPGGGGPIPLWFASVQVLLEATASVIPGLLVGWMSRERGFTSGAMTGALGAILGNIAQLYMWDIPLSGDLGFHLGVGFVSSLFAASLTNAIGGEAGAALRNRLTPPNPSPARRAG